MRRQFVLALAPLLALAGSAGAASRNVDVLHMKCSDFNALAPQEQSRATAFLEGYAKRDIQEDQVGAMATPADLDVIRKECKRGPEDSFWGKLKPRFSGPAPGEAGGTVTSSGGTTPTGEPTSPGAAGPNGGGSRSPMGASGGASATTGAHILPTAMTCRDFRRLDGALQGDVIAFLDGYDRGKTESKDAVPMLDVDRDVSSFRDACGSDENARLRARVKDSL